MADASRRVCVVAGTVKYAEGLEELGEVREEIALVRSVFDDVGLEVVAEEVRLDPLANALRKAIDRAKLGEAGRPVPDILVLYYSGHGYPTTGGYRLATLGGAKGDPVTSVTAYDLADMVSDSGLKQVVVILDACYAGTARLDFQHYAQTIAVQRVKAPAVYLLTAASSVQPATPLVFAGALSSSLRNPGVPSNKRYLQLGDLCREINHRMGRGQTAEAYIPPEGTDWLRAFPNPRHSRLRPYDLPEAASDSGWAFCGRVRALGELVDHVTGAAHDGRAVNVTGNPGSGKTTLLAWLAAASAGRRLPTGQGADGVEVPPRCAVLVQAFGQTWESVLKEIGHELEVPYRDGPEAFFGALAKLPGVRGVLIDSVNRVGAFDSEDHATEGALREFTDRVLLPLSKLPSIRLAFSSEAPLGRLDLREMSLDAPEYFEPGDIELLARRILTTRRRTMHRGMTPQKLGSVAAAIRERSRGSFLWGHLFSIDLAGREPTKDEGTVQTSMTDAFDVELARLSHDDPQWAKALLTPLALALGAGMPSIPLWIDVIRRLSGREIDRAALDRLLRLAQEFVTEAMAEDGSTGWRLRREEYRQHLAPQEHAAMAHAAFTEALLDGLDSGGLRRHWSAADDYTRRNLAEHAQRAGMLDELLTDPDFLLRADPARLREALTLSGTRQARDTRDILDRLRRGEPGAEGDLSRLEFLCLAYDRPDMARGIAGRTRPWSSRWMDRRGADHVTAVASPTGDGGYVVIGTSDGEAYHGRIDQSGLRALHSDAAGSGPAQLSAMGIGLLEGRTVAAVGTWDGGLILHDLTTSERFPVEPQPFPDRIVACEVSRHGLLVASSHAWRRYASSDRGDLRVDTGGLLLASAATVVVSGACWTVACCSTGEVVAWGPDGRIRGAFTTPQQQALTLIAAHGEHVFTASNDGTVWRSDLAAANQTCVVEHGGRRVTSLKVVRTDEGTRLLTTGLDGFVRLTPCGPDAAREQTVEVDIGIGIWAADLEADGGLVVATDRGTARLTI
ncbi:caspase family protein [Streptomyces sp. ODS05-4]|uniref:caspase family protein n=1 Tax=Streptomyces sp. ODS05-4 TaxID=2944939 RepID=UPI00210A1713|nr:caspase family protein [Streptomyces sp. ODS05-4]